MTSDSTPRLLTGLKDGLEKAYGSRLKGIFLYGSYATAEQDAESDLDVLILLDSIPHYADEIDCTSSLVAGLSLRYGISISRVFLTKTEWQGDRTPFLDNARPEVFAV